jgi:hypothetical protein
MSLKPIYVGMKPIYYESEANIYGYKAHIFMSLKPIYVGMNGSFLNEK